MEKNRILEISGLTTHFFVSSGTVRAVENLNLTIDREEIVTIVGESGSGKSVTALSIMGLIDEPGKIVSGEINFLSHNLLTSSYRKMQSLRGKELSMVFQNPYTSMHPSMKISDQMIESITFHEKIKKYDAFKRSIQILEKIGIEEPDRVIQRYPFEVSPGIIQRIMLAIALVLRPTLLIADEPTTNLDSISQIQFLDLIKKLRNELKMSVLLITHDFGVVTMMSDKVVVMYAGKSVESGSLSQIIKDPKHPYSNALLKSVKTLNNNYKLNRLEQIPGEVPDVMRLPEGCSFRTRCSVHEDICFRTPPNIVLKDNRTTSCWLYQN